MPDEGSGSGPAQAPTSRSSRRTAVALVLVVLLILVGALMAFWRLGGPSPSDGRPSIAFGAPTSETDGFTFAVASASSAETLGSFRVGLRVNGTEGTTLPLNLSLAFVIQANPYTVSLTDGGRVGALDVPDRFHVTRSGGLPPGVRVVFSLLWGTGSGLANVSYESPPDPLFSLAIPLGKPVVTDIETATRVLPLSAFAAVLVRYAETVSVLVPLEDGATNGSLQFADRDLDGRLSVGDRFTASSLEAGFYSLAVFYAGRQVGGQGWGESPVVAFGAETIGPTAVSVNVIGVSLPTRLSEFAATVLRNGVEIGRIDRLDGPPSGNLSFTDPNANLKLDAGDIFTISSTASGSYDLVLRWRGSIVAQKSWAL